MTGEKKKEYTLKISTANRTQLVVILYEMLLDYVADAENAYTKNSPGDFRSSIKKARNCNAELMNSLNYEYEIADNLVQLYRYVNKQLTRADIRFQPEPLEPVKNVISKLCEAFREVGTQDTSPAVMENTQTVYAGLTYGKNHLVENLTDQGTDRGFRI